MCVASKESCWVTGTYPLKASEECHICDMEFADRAIPTRKQGSLIWENEMAGDECAQALSYGVPVISYE